MESRAGDFKTKCEFEQTRKPPLTQNVFVIGKPVKYPNIPIEEDITAIDYQSRMGRFGWPENRADKFYGIPYILRNSVKYFSAEMILMKQPIRSYMSRMQPHVYEYFYQIKELATRAECHLLNDINRIHCDKKFGEKFFTNGSCIIKDTDAYALLEFLDTCFKALSIPTRTMPTKVGFIQFSFSGIFIPFVTVNNEQYMPLSCFSNTNNMRVDFISGWDLAYLRFCCLYQGIWKRPADFFAVVSLSSMSANLPIDSRFDICWPTADHGLFRRALSTSIEPKQPAQQRNVVTESTIGRSNKRKVSSEMVNGQLPKKNVKVCV